MQGKIILEMSTYYYALEKLRQIRYTARKFDINHEKV